MSPPRHRRWLIVAAASVAALETMALLLAYLPEPQPASGAIVLELRP